MHLARKAFHMSGVVIVAAYRLLEAPRAVMSAALGAVVALLALLDLLRAKNAALQAWFQKSFRVILDAKDARGLNGSTLYFGGCLLAVALFPADAACGGILALALGDSTAAIVGSSVRSPRLGRGSVAGSLACFVAASVGCFFFAPWPHALAGGAVATVLEACSGTKLDNLTMPVGVALALHLL